MMLSSVVIIWHAKADIMKNTIRLQNEGFLLSNNLRNYGWSLINITYITYCDLLWIRRSLKVTLITVIFLTEISIAMKIMVINELEIHKFVCVNRIKWNLENTRTPCNKTIIFTFKGTNQFKRFLHGLWSCSSGWLWCVV